MDQSCKLLFVNLVLKAIKIGVDDEEMCLTYERSFAIDIANGLTSKVKLRTHTSDTSSGKNRQKLACMAPLET